MKTLILASLALGGLAAPAWAQAQAAKVPACHGSYEIVRTSTIKPGKMDLFLKAVRDHQAWYVAHGKRDRIMVGRVLTHEDASGLSPTTAMTFHTDMSTLGPPPHAADDTAWNAYVAEYQASADLTDMKPICREAVR